MKFSAEQTKDIVTTLAIILHLGNVEFVTQGGAQISSRQVVAAAAKLLGVDNDNLSEVLTQIKRVVRGEEIFTPLDLEQVSGVKNTPVLHSHRLLASVFLGSRLSRFYEYGSVCRCL